MKVKRIACIDDHDSIRKLAHLILSGIEEYKVTTYESGEQALQHLEAFAPDMILLDMIMPGLSGIETFHAIKKLPSLTHVPVVLLTACIEENDMKQYRKLDIVGIIRKPFAIGSFANQVASFLL